MVTGLDNPKLYATAGDAAKPIYEVIAVGGDAAKSAPADQGPNPLPAPGSLIAYDEASQMVHILGLAPGVSSAAGPWTVYVVEPHGNAVYADARLPDGFVPAAWGADFNPMYPSADRQQLLLFDGAGASATDRCRLARLRLAAARGHRRGADGRRSSICWPGSSSAAA